MKGLIVSLVIEVVKLVTNLVGNKKKKDDKKECE